MQLQTVPAAKVNFAALAMCRGLGTQATSHIAAVSSLQRKAAGETLFNEGDEADCIYEITSGMLRLYKLLPDGRRQIMGFLTAGHLLGLAPEGTYVYTAETLTDVALCRYRRSGFERLIDNVPGLARRLWAFTADELRMAQDQLMMIGRKTAMEKIASFLLMQAELQGTPDEIRVPMTRSDIGDYLGLTIETVSRTLTKLKRDGVIAVPRLDRIELCDHDQLEELASGDADADF